MNRRASVRVPLLVCALLALGAPPARGQAPMEVGDHHPLHVDSAGASDIERRPTATGVAYRLTHDGATYLALYFAEFDLAPGDRLVISDPAGEQRFVLEGRGKMGAGAFWAQHIKGDQVILRFDTEGERGSRFVIDGYAAGYVDLGGPAEAICGADDKDNAVCYQSTHPTEYGQARAVARLLIQGTSLCTGWLASASNHLVTNEHCISTSSAALNTDFEFGAEAPDCGSGNCQLCWAGTIFSGATFIQDNASLDYALVQITSGDPAATYGFLNIDNRSAVVGEEIYIPQHPGGRAKELGVESSDPADPGSICHVTGFTNPCSGSGYQDVGYQCDTEGGSSGSPVLARSSHQVIALHHCANCPNRGVPIDLICDEICSLLGPACSVNSDCDDLDACTSDSCVASECVNEPIANCCGNGTCESGEDCFSCAADCISGGGGAACGNGVCEPGAGEDCLSCAADCAGKQNGKPSNRYCCGDGDGENPVGCGDSRCTAGGFACGTSPDPFCCGDLACDPGEDPMNCVLDCPAGSCGNGSCEAGESQCSCSTDCGAPPGTELFCGDGIDNDCDGLIDTDDPDCAVTCAPKNGSCSIDEDCCSLSCKPNGRCR